NFGSKTILRMGYIQLQNNGCGNKSSEPRNRWVEPREEVGHLAQYGEGLILNRCSILMYQVQEFLLDLSSDINGIVGAIVHRHRIETVDPDIGGFEFLALQMGVKVQGCLGSGIGGQAVIGIAKGFVLHFAQIAQGGSNVDYFGCPSLEQQGLHQFDDPDDRKEIDLVDAF